MTEDERNRLRERFTAEQEDRSQRRRRHKATSSDVFRNVSLILFVALLGVWLFNRTGSLPPSPKVAEHAAPPIQPLRSAPISAPAAATTSIKPQPLSDCMKADNLIDESVVTCRFGKYPSPQEKPDVQGMVSAQYMEKFKAQQQRVAVRHEQFMESFLIRQWDGRATHLAQWSVTDNQIDSTSVCANHRRGSISYRECRKGIKVWFKEQCHNGRNGEAAHSRYCSAASGFSPMG